MCGTQNYWTWKLLFTVQTSIDFKDVAKFMNLKENQSDIAQNKNQLGLAWQDRNISGLALVSVALIVYDKWWRLSARCSLN